LIEKNVCEKIGFETSRSRAFFANCMRSRAHAYARTQTSYTNLPNNCCSYVNSQSATPFASLRIRVRVMQIRPGVCTQRRRESTHGRVRARRRVQYTGRIRACELPERDSERGVARGRRRDGNASATMIELVEIHCARITHSMHASS